MFAHIPDFELSVNNLQPAEMVELMNEIVRVFDDITDKYDVCKIKIKSIGNYMIAAGLFNGANIVSDEWFPSRVDEIISGERFD